VDKGFEKEGKLTVCRAGAVAIVKCVKLPSLGTEDDCRFSVHSSVSVSGHHLTSLIDNEADLFVWDFAESSVTIMAACIPTLRVFLREKTSRPSDERTTRFSQFSLSFRSVNRGRRMFGTQTIEVISEHSVEKGDVVMGSGASRDGSAAATGSDSGKPAVGEKNA